MHCTVWCSAVCGFIIRKPHNPHRTAPSLYINLFIFLILNILLINGLISLVFKKYGCLSHIGCMCLVSAVYNLSLQLQRLSPFIIVL